MMIDIADASSQNLNQQLKGKVFPSLAVALISTHYAVQTKTRIDQDYTLSQLFLVLKTTKFKANLLSSLQ